MIIPAGLMSTEHEVGQAVLAYLKTRPHGEASLQELFFSVPRYIRLTAADKEVSRSRPGDLKWHSRVRNIDAHKTSEGNLIHDGVLIKRPKRWGGGYQLAERAARPAVRAAT